MTLHAVEYDIMEPFTRAVILAGGEHPAIEAVTKLCRHAAFVVAADSGLLLARSAGIEPHLVVGDMDSLSPVSLLDGLPSRSIERFPHDKDETDTEIAVRRCTEKGYPDYTVLGAGGGRLDHLLAVYALFDRAASPARWYTRGDRMIRLTGATIVYGLRGRTVSLFPAGIPSGSPLLSRGLKWNLDGLVWRRGDFGVSNVVLEDPFEVQVEEGALLLVYGETR
jgi:thiamine pyrophosphokinase